MQMQVRVECYAGYRADQRPVRFELRGHPFEVREVDDQWYSPDATYFRVLADDGNFYVLRHEESKDVWTLDGFRAARASTVEAAMTERHREMRKHQRILVPGNRLIRASANGDGPRVQGTVTVIGLGGMFIRTSNSLPSGTVLHVKLTEPLGVIETDCVVRNVAENGLGVEFAGVSPEDEEKLKALLLSLKG